MITGIYLQNACFRTVKDVENHVYVARWEITESPYSPSIRYF